MRAENRGLNNLKALPVLMLLRCQERRVAAGHLLAAVSFSRLAASCLWSPQLLCH